MNIGAIILTLLHGNQDCGIPIQNWMIVYFGI